jgi:hypothetical protein
VGDVVESERVRERWSIAHTGKDSFHQIVSLHDTPTMTLILTGKRSEWGFLTPEGYVDQETYIKQKGLPR